MITAWEIRARRVVMAASLGRRKMRLRKKAPRPRFPHGAEQRYMAALDGVSKESAAVIKAVVVPALGGIMAEAARYRENGRADAADVGDAITRTIGSARLQLGERFPESRLKGIAAAQATNVNTFNRADVGRQVKSVLGIELGHEPAVGPHIDLFIRDNVKLIKSIPDTLLSQVEDIVGRAARSGRRVEDLAADLQERFDVSESKAALIARDQTGKLNGELTQIRQEALGAVSYVWRTSLDERVREEHAAREGETFQWDDPPDGGAPGEDYQCRCTAEFVAEELLDRLEADDAPADSGDAE